MTPTAIRENLRQAKDLFLILWYHGTFPLSVVSYAFTIGFGIGIIAGRFL